MTVADTLRTVGRPIAYYPMLAKRLGGVNAAVFFCQIFYWQDKATSPLGVHKTRDELELETGLTHEEQVTARRKLKNCGVLIETTKRIDHKVYFRVDEIALEALLAVDPAETANNGFGKPGKMVSGNRKSRLGETANHGSAKPQKPVPRNGKPRRREAGDHGFVNEVKTTAETTKKSSSNTREATPVDNSLLPLLPSVEKPRNPEQSLISLLVGLPRCVIDSTKDRDRLQLWLDRGVTPAQFVDAHRLAISARDRDTDGRPIYAGFLARFVDEVVAGSAPLPDPDEPWWKAEETVIARGAALGVRPVKPDEHWGLYRVLVAAASRERGAIDFVLADALRFNNERLYQFARTTFGPALMPVDDYAS